MQRRSSVWDPGEAREDSHKTCSQDLWLMSKTVITKTYQQFFSVPTTRWRQNRLSQSHDGDTKRKQFLLKYFKNDWKWYNSVLKAIQTIWKIAENDSKKVKNKTKFRTYPNRTEYLFLLCEWIYQWVFSVRQVLEVPWCDTNQITFCSLIIKEFRRTVPIMRGLKYRLQTI